MWDPCHSKDKRVCPIQKEEMTHQKLVNEICVTYDPSQISSTPGKCHGTYNRDQLKLSANKPIPAYELEPVASNYENEIGSSQLISSSTANISSSSSSSQVQIRPAGKSCQAQTRQPVHHNHSSWANKSKGKQPVKENLCSSYAARSGRIQHPQGFKQVWQVKKKTDPTKDLPQSSTKVWRVKESKQISASTSKSSAKKNARRRRSKQWKGSVQCITLDDGLADSDSDETHEPVGYTCCLCEDDLAFSPISADPVFKSNNFPDVALLLCGHVFHMACLEQGMSDEQLKDPPCFICASLS